jgi:transposase
MPKTPADLPDSVEDLRALVVLQQGLLTERDDEIAKHEQSIAIHEESIAKHEQTVSEYSNEISQLREYVRLLKSHRFGPKSERSGSSQLGFFNEAEAALDEQDGREGEESEDDSVEIPAHRRRKRGGRRPLPDHLPRIEVLRDLDESEKVCRHDASHALSRIGEERAERIVYRPAELFVEVEIRPKYACGTCKDGVACQKPSPQPIPKSLASASLLAQIVTAKYVDGLPLYRQEKIFERIGIELSRTTMAAWVIRMGEQVEPILDLVLEKIRRGDHVLADETPFQVLKEKGKRATSTSYLWALRGGDPEHPLLYYEYAPSRSGEVAERLLEGFTGFLQTDGYKGYDRFDGKVGVVHVGCFAHARRKFDEALRGQGGLGRNKKKSSAKQNTKHSVARQGLTQINELYRTERSYAEASLEERSLLRKEKLAPQLEALREWTLTSKDRVPPESLSGKAMSYLDSQWPKLVRVLDDARLPLDTNAVERAIRPFVIGRRNWLFADTPRGATASARLYSLVETAKANGVEPWTYLEAVFTVLPRAQNPSDFEALLPWRIELPEAAHRIAQR